MELVSLLLLLPTVFGHFLPSLLGQPVTSNSGPSEVDEGADEHGHRDKRSYRYWYSHSQYSYSNNLLISSEPPDNYLKKWLTYEHNRYRRMVPATDMHMLYWSDELAASAQRHADTCDFRHSRGRVNVGENIWAAPYSNYSDAISIWFNEARLLLSHQHVYY
ncbi:hypothetical protein WR25_18081 [Diploscapter pachys]|uniref:SCP domain-containing protein n=1 Tax=Diploscapter pachys TaxID=2018661 RepID=A0A2A2LL07_9BILA|nr:hypothetical protein WR25_18081 [Diploscapter pachys]